MTRRRFVPDKPGAFAPGFVLMFNRRLRRLGVWQRFVVQESRARARLWPVLPREGGGDELALSQSRWVVDVVERYYRGELSGLSRRQVGVEMRSLLRYARLAKNPRIQRHACRVFRACRVMFRWADQ